ncbi:MAG: hemerythrin domain-containing protein [Magnetococcales bacterium]|nr:hemerythrin domain-containing protein [Magnetococcales bacterium]
MSKIILQDVGVEQFNNDHKRLFFYIEEFNRLSERFKDREPFDDEWDQINTIFPRLEKYTEHHFKAEEDMMRQNNYQHMLEHFAQHKSLTQHLQTLKVAIKTRKYSYLSGLESFLFNWLQNHINKEDLKYKDCFEIAETKKIIDTALFNEMVSASQLRQIMHRTQPDTVILDIRTNTEFEEGIIPGSSLYHCEHNLTNRQDTRQFKDYFLANFDTSQFDTQKRYFLVCRSGPRTEIAIETFLDRGFMACELIGGIEEWKRQSYPIIPVSDKTHRIR